MEHHQQIVVHVSASYTRTGRRSDKVITMTEGFPTRPHDNSTASPDPDQRGTPNSRPINVHKHQSNHNLTPTRMFIMIDLIDFACEWKMILSKSLQTIYNKTIITIKFINNIARIGFRVRLTSASANQIECKTEF